MPLLGEMRRLLRLLAKGTLDERRAGLVLRIAALLALAVALVLVGVDPSPRATRAVTGSIGSVVAFEQADAVSREAIVGQWRAAELIPRVRLFVQIDAFAFAPLLAVVLLALRHAAILRMRRDQAVLPLPGARWLTVTSGWAIAVGFVANEVVDALAYLAVESPAPRDWIQIMPAVGLVRFVADALALGIVLFLLVRWYYLFDPARPADGQGRAVKRRARVRASIADMFWRSKYAMLVLLGYSAMALLMDQTSDALLRLTEDVGQHAPSIVLGVVLTSLAVLSLSLASWLWPRQLLRLAGPSRQHAPAGADAYAKWWPRALGLVPLVVAGWTIARTLHDEPGHSLARPWLEGFLALDLLGFAAYSVFVGWRPRRDPALGYYARARDATQARDDLRGLTALATWAPPLLFFGVRATSLLEWTPPLPLAVVSSGMAAWAAVLGWSALASRRLAVPYLMGVVVAMILLAASGWAEVHRIRIGDDAPDAPGVDMRLRFAWTALLALPCLAFAWIISRPRATLVCGVVSAVVALAAIAAILAAHDRREPSLAPVERQSLPVAMGAWLDAQANRDAGGELPVYFISAEGGGIRSAYWTASVLTRLQELDPRFAERTFSISAVSGGAMGVAAFRACDLESNRQVAVLRRCIDRFGGSDLWTQLIGAVLFEDLLASVLPTPWCQAPGCGLLGRSGWFEGTMESAVPSLRRGMVRSAPGDEGPARRPHLFLTVTRVESGERWIQSELLVTPDVFPGACDVLGVAGGDLRLSTAAHNSSRFPYTNPVGALYGSRSASAPHKPAGTAGGAGLEPPKGWRCAGKVGKPVLRARLQDGGYFDDSATATVLDQLRVLNQCLARGCGSFPVSKADKLRSRIRPMFIAIRNEDRFPTLDDKADGKCWMRDPAEPVDAQPLRAWPGLLSAGITLYGTRTAHMRAAEAALELEAGELWQRLGAEWSGDRCSKWGPGQAARPYHRLDLLDDATLYPSGWVLSGAAMKGIRNQVDARLASGIVSTAARDAADVRR